MYRKGIKRVVFCVVILAAIFGCSALAGEIMPRYVYTNYVDAGLKFENGRAYSTGSIFPYDFRATSVEVRLQQYYENDWRTIGLWTDSSSAGLSDAGGSEEIDRGFEYRTYTRGKVYDSNGNVLETIHFYSDVKYY